MRLLLTADPEIEVPPRLYGGIERIVDVLVRRLKAKGHQVGLVARAGSTCPADVFYPWPGKSSLSRGDTVSNTLALWQAKRDFRPDLVHSFSRIAYLTPHLRGRVPLVMSFQREPTPRTVGFASDSRRRARSPSPAAANTSRATAGRAAANGSASPTSPTPRACISARPCRPMRHWSS